MVAWDLIRVKAREIRTRNCPPPDIVFGRPSRPRSPIYDVIGKALRFLTFLIKFLEHKFQRNWLLQQKARDEAREQVVTYECTESGSDKHAGKRLSDHRYRIFIRHFMVGKYSLTVYSPI